MEVAVLGSTFIISLIFCDAVANSTKNQVRQKKKQRPLSHFTSGDAVNEFIGERIEKLIVAAPIPLFLNAKKARQIHGICRAF
ncbi:hypothetical protein [Abditibacterium utsteinense]|uniref:hypothetical protein n=1 Tax=Abditibacterium utsteinense TaxID=1960156 RepID=UPI000D091956|nr:hypothetical protein [Abditibacterium utsteinense]